MHQSKRHKKCNLFKYDTFTYFQKRHKMVNYYLYTDAYIDRFINLCNTFCLFTQKIHLGALKCKIWQITRSIKSACWSSKVKIDKSNYEHHFCKSSCYINKDFKYQFFQWSKNFPWRYSLFLGWWLASETKIKHSTYSCLCHLSHQLTSAKCVLLLK